MSSFADPEIRGQALHALPVWSARADAAWRDLVRGAARSRRTAA